MFCKWVVPYITIAIAVLVSHCGPDEKFDGFDPTDPNGAQSEDVNRSKASGEGKLDQDGTVSAALLHWHWACSREEKAPEIDLEGDPVIHGAGPHPVRIQGQTIEIITEISLCRSQPRQRDIVFAVDVSKGMRDADPENNNTCGRKDAIARFLDNLSQPEQVRVALITFDNRTVLSTSFATVEDFHQGYLNQEDLCRARLLAPREPSYQRALDPAEELFEEARDGVDKEVFLIGGGDPSNPNDGVGYANELKKQGVIIHTVMHKHDGSHFADKIASQGYNDKPIHHVTENPNALGKALLIFEDSPITGGAIQNRPIGREDWRDQQEMAAAGPIDSYTYTISEVDLINTPDGLELSIQYWNSIGRTFSRSGILDWKN